MTSRAPVELLALEGIERGVHVVGDVMYDAQRLFRDAAERTGARERLGLEPGRYGLVTLHRAENTDDPERLRSIAAGLLEIASRLPLVLPLHPRTRGALAEIGEPLDGPGLHVVEPASYLEMQALESHAAVVLTDSGGVQKEAYFHGVPCVTMRDETEWTETVDQGWNTLVGAHRRGLVDATLSAVESPPRTAPEEVYGDGRASDRIASALLGERSGRESAPSVGESEGRRVPTTAAARDARGARVAGTDPLPPVSRN